MRPRANMCLDSGTGSPYTVKTMSLSELRERVCTTRHVR